MGTENSMGTAIFALWAGALICELHGLYLSAIDGFGPFLVALFIPAWAILKGLLGFF